jgi:hypothetical protein
MGMITINRITTAINMIPSVDPASGRATAVAMIVVVVSRVGVTVDSWTIGKGRLSARLVNDIVTPSKTQNATRTVFDFVFIAALLDFKYIMLAIRAIFINYMSICLIMRYNLSVAVGFTCCALRRVT